MAVKKTNSPVKQGTQLDFMREINDLGEPIAAITGFAVGKLALKKLSKSEAVTGLLGNDAKGYIVPAVVAVGSLYSRRFTKNKYVKLLLIGAAGAGVEATIKKATGKTILSGLGEVLGEYAVDVDYEEMEGLQALNPVTQALPAADIDIEREIQATMSGAASDFSMSDDPIGNAAIDFSMSDEPIGKTEFSDDEEVPVMVGAIKQIDPDSMDYDIFSGDMMAS